MMSSISVISLLVRSRKLFLPLQSQTINRFFYNDNNSSIIYMEKVNKLKVFVVFPSSCLMGRACMC